MCFSLCLPLLRQLQVAGNCMGPCSSTHAHGKRDLVPQKYAVVCLTPKFSPSQLISLLPQYNCGAAVPIKYGL